MAVNKSRAVPGSKLFSAMLAVSALAGVAHGRQLTPQDYARAERFMSYNTGPLVDHDVQQVHWLDNRRFWYIDHDSGGDHYRVMTAPAGRKASVFDQERLAAALGKAIGKPVDATRLGISG